VKAAKLRRIARRLRWLARNPERPRPWDLKVSYRCRTEHGRVGFDWGSPDAEIRRLARRDSDGAGTSLGQRPEREIFFIFASRDAVLNAAHRIRETFGNRLGIRITPDPKVKHR
jgi:hypothetical protein